jgi:hypothetical protein
VPTPRPDQMPTGSNVPVPTPRPKSGAFNMGKFTNVLGALGSIMAGLDTGSPEVKPVGLSGFSHKPDGNIQIALPKGLL